MFFIDDDETDMLKRRKNGGSRTDHHAHIAAPNAPPLVKTFARRQPRMENRRVFAKPRPKPHDHLRCKRNFRNKYDRRLAQLRRLTNGADKDLRLSASRHAVKKEAAFPLLNCREEFRQHIFLLAGQLWILLRELLHGAIGIAQFFPLFQLDKAHLHERVDRIAAIADRFLQCR